MSVDSPPARPRRRALPRFAEADTLRHLPPRRPADPPTPASPLQWVARAADQYEVTLCGETVGFIDVVGAVFVSLAGSRRDRAVEVAQSLVFENALDALNAPPPQR